MKNSIKRFFSVLLCVVFVFSLFTVTGSAEENAPAFRLSVDGEVKVGNRVRLFVSVENMPQFSQADFHFTYEPTCLECPGVSKPSKNETALWISGDDDEGNAQCSIAFYSPAKGNLDIAVVSFNVLDTANTTVTVSVTGLDCDDAPETVQFDLKTTTEPVPVQFDFDYEIVNSEAVITDCNMESTGDLVIPEAIDGYPVTTIKKSAFGNCDKITSVVIPDSVVTIEEFAFNGCDGLKSVTIGSGVRNLGRSIFRDCKNLEKVEIKNGVTYISEEMFSLCVKLRSVSLPDSIRIIKEKAFECCYVLTEIHIPVYVETIENSAFYMCHSLESIRLPRKVIRIESHTFYQCESLEAVFFDGNITKIGSYAFAESGLNGFDVHGYVTEIESSAFENCKKLVTVNIGYGVKKIGSSAFYGCPMLKDISIPASVTEIGTYAIGYGDFYSKVFGFTLFGMKGTVAEEYASKNKLPFETSDADNVIGLSDVNRDSKVNAADARLALRCSARIEALEGINFVAADVDKNGKITAADARLILRKSARVS